MTHTLLPSQGHCTRVVCRAQTFPAAPWQRCRRHPPPTPAREQQTQPDICKLHSECFETASQVSFGKALSDLPHSENVLYISEHFVTRTQEGALQRWLLSCFRVTSSCPCDSQTLWSWRKSSPRHQKSFHTQAVVQELPGLQLSLSTRPCWSRAQHGPCNSCGRWRSCQGLLLLLCWELRQSQVRATRHTHLGTSLGPFSCPLPVLR